MYVVPVNLTFMVHSIGEESNRIKALAYQDFKLKNGQIVR